MSLALTREVNLDMQSSDGSAEEMRESGRSFQSLIVLEKSFSYRCLFLQGNAES